MGNVENRGCFSQVAVDDTPGMVTSDSIDLHTRNLPLS
jgi:hypothetical protein